jgi:hypothetical protein
VLPAPLADENVPAGTVAALRSAGFEVLAVADGYQGVSDRAVLALAREPRPLVDHLRRRLRC